MKAWWTIVGLLGFAASMCGAGCQSPQKTPETSSKRRIPFQPETNVIPAEMTIGDRGGGLRASTNNPLFKDLIEQDVRALNSFAKLRTARQAVKNPTYTVSNSSYDASIEAVCRYSESVLECWKADGNALDGGKFLILRAPRLRALYDALPRLPKGMEFRITSLRLDLKAQIGSYSRAFLDQSLESPWTRLTTEQLRRPTSRFGPREEHDIFIGVFRSEEKWSQFRWRIGTENRPSEESDWQSQPFLPGSIYASEEKSVSLRSITQVDIGGGNLETIVRLGPMPKGGPNREFGLAYAFTPKNRFSSWVDSDGIIVSPRRAATMSDGGNGRYRLLIAGGETFALRNLADGSAEIRVAAAPSMIEKLDISFFEAKTYTFGPVALKPN